MRLIMTKNLDKIFDLVKRAKAEDRDLTDEELRALAEDAPNSAETPSNEDGEETPSEDATNSAETKADEAVEASGETPSNEDDEEPTEDAPSDEAPSEDTEDTDTPSDEGEDENKDDKNSTSRSLMNKKFSLIKTIRALAENKPLDENTKAIIEQGRSEMRSAGISSQGQIVLPTEKRAVVSVTADGENVVSEDVFDLLTPLRAKNVLAEAGAKFYTNLTGDVKIPIMSASNVTFEGENAEAKDGAGAFTSVVLSPKRLTAYVDISKQMLAQDSIDIENAIREDLIAAINGKIESAILSDFTGSTEQFKGVFAEVAPTAVADFKALVEKEAEVEDANAIGSPVYVLSNKAKADLRAMAKGAKSTQLVYENGEVDGTKAYNTSHVSGHNYLYGDMSNIIIGTWNGIDLVVDNYTQATKGVVRLVVNLYVDAKVARPEALTAGNLA